MKFSGQYLYRVRVTAWPPGSHRRTACGLAPVQGWTPPGWRPTPEYIERLGTCDFVWPTTTHVWASRTSAKKRADLIASFGATTVIERSSRITWPDPEGASS